MAKSGKLSTPERSVPIRIVEGIDRTEDQRIGNPAAYYTTQNLYSPVPGILAKRPGTRLICDGVATGQFKGVPGSTRLSDLVVTIARGESQTVIEPALNTQTRLDNTVTGLFGLKAKIITAKIDDTWLSSDLLDNTPYVITPPKRVAGLHRVYFDIGTRRYWIGAVNFGGDHSDKLFFLLDDKPNSQAQIIYKTAGAFTSEGADFFFTDFYYRLDGDDEKKAYYIIGTNQVDKPFTIKDGVAAGFTGNSLLVTSSSLDICSYQAWNGVTTEPAATYKRVVGVAAICVYQGSVVYAGYDTVIPSTGARTNRRNFACFSDPKEPHIIASESETSEVFLDVQVGMSPADEITSVAINTIDSDSDGLHGQLVFFTGRRIKVFDGTPPSTGNPPGGEDVDFGSPIGFDVGTWAPRSVVSTPHGLIFLGSDGMVYLLPAYSRSGPQPIGMAVWDILRDMTPQQQKQCNAIWHPEGYYLLSYPDGGGPSNVRPGGLLAPGKKGKKGSQPIPNRQIWADLRNISAGAGVRDSGIRWFGPHTNMLYSCMAIATGPNDKGQIFAGHAKSGSVFEIWQKSLTTDPDPTVPGYATQWSSNTSKAVGDRIRPANQARVNQIWEVTSGSPTGATEPAWPGNPTINVTTVTDNNITWMFKGYWNPFIDTIATTGLIDLGDAHVDKTVTAGGLGVSVSKSTSVEIKVIVSGPAASDEYGQTFNFTVAPPQTFGGQTFANTKFAPSDDIQFLSCRPAERLRGRSFRFEVRETPERGAQVQYSDLGFRVNVATRRK